MRKINEGRVKEALQKAIKDYYLEEPNSIEIISKLTGMDYDQVLKVLNKSTEENAMRNLMSYDDGKVMSFESFNESNKEKYQEMKFNAEEMVDDNEPGFTTDIDDQEKMDKLFKKEMSKIAKFEDFKK